MRPLRQVGAWFRRGRLDRDIAAELQSHLELRADANQADGMAVDAARRDAARRLGNDLLLRERTRDVHIPRGLADLLRDLGFAARGLRRNPGFTLVAMLTLALGIGAGTAMFSVVNAVLINTLPYPESSRLVRVKEAFQLRGHTVPADIAEGAFEAIRRSGAFSRVEYLENLDGSVELDGFAVNPQMYRASAGYFALLGLVPAQGRGLRWDAHEVVISDAFWRTAFHADPHVLGHALLFDHQPYTVAGVLPPGRGYPTDTDIWILGAPQARSGGFVFARLPLDLPVARALRRAQAALTVIGHRPGLLRTPPGTTGRLTVAPMNAEQAESAARIALLTLLTAVGFVLLIACANAAALLLARSAGRGRELAIRRALGASRWQILRQLLAEALCLAAGGAFLGCLLAAVAVRLARYGPASIPRLQSAQLDFRALGFALAAAIFSALACGLAPALRFSRPDPQQGFQGGPQATRSTPRRGLLLIAEIALTMVLLVGAALMIRSFDRMGSVDPGFNPHSILVFDVIAPDHFAGVSEHDSWLRISRMDQSALERIRALPGVVAASDGGNLFSGYEDPLGESYSRPGLGTVRATTLNVGHDYFHTLGVALLRGRDFTTSDLVPPPAAVFATGPFQSLPPVPPAPVLINQMMAQALWPAGNAIGQILIQDPSFRLVVIGIVGNTRNISLAQAERPEVYFPMTGNWFDATFVVRSTLPAATLIPAVRQALLAADPSLALGEPQTLIRAMAPTLASPRFRMLLLSLFAALALLLALVGLYASLAYQVQQRTREIGVRMALGARRAAVAAMILRQSLILLALGLALGCLLAWALTRFLASLLFGISALDPTTWIAAAGLLLLAGLAASYLPARRATRVDPVIALRCD